VVQLVHPSGAVAVLHNNDGGSSANLNETYGMGGTQNAELKKLFGLPSQGVWKLRIKDSAGADTGTLDSVKLSLKGYLE
jgi:aminopeptidase S